MSGGCRECRRFPLPQNSSAPTTGDQGHHLNLSSGAGVREFPAVPGHSSEGGNNMDLNKVGLVQKENSRWELQVKESKLGSAQLPCIGKLSLLIFSSSNTQSAKWTEL